MLPEDTAEKWCQNCVLKPITWDHAHKVEVERKGEKGWIFMTKGKLFCFLFLFYFVFCLFLGKGGILYKGWLSN